MSDYRGKIGQSKIPDIKLRQLITHFGNVPLRNEDFEFPDLLGAAYEYMIGQFADSAGKKGGEFYTPRSVVRMMVRLLKPELRHDIYDPCCGSGGMLIAAKEYIDEHGEDGRKANLFGQEFNGTVWSIAKMNMLLHGISNADLHNDDTLADPQHVEGGELMHFDRVLTNPPFSINWGHTEKNTDGTLAWQPRFEAERFTYGQVPLGAKKADLMFLQHLLAVTRDGGMVATVMPHGVLFRGGEERGIRAGIIEHDLLEAVIGVAPNLFYGTGIPACILVLRQRVQNGARRMSGKPAERRGKVLFINADSECFEGRAQNFLLPEHIEKIVHTFDAFRAIPGFSAIVDNATLKANDYNLNIRRYLKVLQFIRPKAESQAVGSTVKGIRIQDYLSIPAHLAPTNEQPIIARILDTLDTAIHETEAIIAKLKAVKQGLLHDLLTRGIAANGELRPPQAEAPNLYKDSPLGWIPKEWGVKPLGEILAEPTKNGLYKPSQFHGRGPLMVQMGGCFLARLPTLGQRREFKCLHPN